MRTVWKYTAPISDRVTFDAPAGAHLIHAAVEEPHRLTVWLIVNTDEKPAPYDVAVVGTGNPLSSDLYPWDHLATVRDGALIWHVFDAREIETAP